MTMYKGWYDGGREDICPLCGGQLDYEGGDELCDNSMGWKWTCSECGTDGIAWYELEFGGHGIADSDVTAIYEKKGISMTMYKEWYDGGREDICPLCGGQLDYGGGDELCDNSMRWKWTCSECGTDGIAWYELEFGGHGIAEGDVPEVGG